MRRTPIDSRHSRICCCPSQSSTPPCAKVNTADGAIHRHVSRLAPVLPVNDIRGIDSLNYVKNERYLRCKLASLFRVIDLYGWNYGTCYNHVSVSPLTRPSHHAFIRLRRCESTPVPINTSPNPLAWLFTKSRVRRWLKSTARVRRRERVVTHCTRWSNFRLHRRSR